MKIKCKGKGTRAIRFEGHEVKFSTKGVGTIPDEIGARLIKSNTNFTEVKGKKESSDVE